MDQVLIFFQKRLGEKQSGLKRIMKWILRNEY